jgi:hypothetical protein
MVTISKLGASYSPRREIDEEHIHRLAQSEAPLPPILVHRANLRIIDGVHRLHAAILRGMEEVEVVFFDGTEEEAFIRAVAENVSHGLPLTLADRKTAAAHIITSHPHLSDREIARHAGLAAKTVAALRQRSSEDLPLLNTRTGADGRRRPVNWSEGRRRAAEAITQRPDAPLREIARIAGVSVGTAHDVRLRLRRGDNPLLRPVRGEGQEHSDPPRPCPPRQSGDASPSGAAIRTPARESSPDPSSMLRKLANDPALRHTDQGRELLRLLHSRLIAISDWSTLVDAVPPHRAEAVIMIARYYAECWDRLARELEHRDGILR